MKPSYSAYLPNPDSVLFAVRKILDSFPDIRHIELIEPRPVPLLQDRCDLREPLALAVEKGLQLRSATHMAFWDAVLLSCFGLGSVVEPLLREACFHNRTVLGSQTLAVGDCSIHHLEQLCAASARSGRVLALRSRVTLEGGQIAHIPMIDFHCPARDENASLAATALEALEAGPGFLVESGDSYHFLGLSLLDEGELPPFLARALLLSPIVDRAWIAHQLLEGSCALRVSGRQGEDSGPRVLRKMT
jgi:hypothetical protein